jgi:hypothetical protein
MVRTPVIVAAFVAVVASSCASSAPGPASPATASAASVIAPPPTPDAAPDIVPIPLSEQDKNLPPLAPGRCRKTFDCDDTASLPPPGHRWGCERGKCVAVRLPSLGGAAPAPKPLAAQPKSKAKLDKSRRQHR